MTRPLRRWHLIAWLALGPMMLLGLLAALAARPPAPAQAEVGAAAPVKAEVVAAPGAGLQP